MQTLPFYVYAVFILTVITTIGLFYKAADYSKRLLIIISAWVIFQSVLGMNNFYTINTLPPRFLLLALPPVLLLLTLLATPAGRRFIDRLHLGTLTLLHLIRIPVEIVLYWLFLHKAIPAAMTFEGRNFDIFSGLTAPFIWYWGIVKGRLNRTILILWNLISLALLLNIVTISIQSSATTPFAIGYFPFMLLPGCLVPLVLYSHMAAIRQLITSPLPA